MRRCFVLMGLMLCQSLAANVRVSHVAPQVLAVDVYLNRALKFQNVPFSSVTPYLQVPDGAYDVAVYRTGDQSRPLIAGQNLTLTNGTYTLAAIGSGERKAYETTLLRDDLRRASNLAQLRVIHASADVQQISVRQRGLIVARDLSYRQASPYIPLVPGKVVFRVTWDAGRSFTLPDYTLIPGQVYTLFLINSGVSGSLSGVLVTDSSMANRTSSLP